MSHLNKLGYLSPKIMESPTEYADRLGIAYSSKVKPEHKKILGQYFTPSPVAEFMASFAKVAKQNIRILDPGCGIGILSCSLIEKIIDTNPNVREIYLVAFESDNGLLEFTDLCLGHLSKWVKSKGVKFAYFLCKNDFILHNSLILEKYDFIEEEKYDFIITNPPYFKLNKKDERVVAAQPIICGQSNIYSIFLMISARLLNGKGKLIFITPRSFTSGSYFRSFREQLLKIVDITNIHLFVSRKVAFERDKVLQENIIMVAARKEIDETSQLKLEFPSQLDSKVSITYSNGINDLGNNRIKVYLANDLINYNSTQKIIHVPITEQDEKAIKIFKQWKNSLSDLGFKVSTGPVVDFRSTDFIAHRSSNQSVPLIYLHNVNKMTFQWPSKNLNKGKIKGEYILYNKLSESRLIKNKDYILMRRFSSKDDNSRLIATPYFARWLANYCFIGIENHLNYIYKNDGEFKSAEILGLSALLNSRLFDTYFRTFNGNINVSATELRDMPLPRLKDIIQIGNKLQDILSKDQRGIDKIVEGYFKVNLE